MRRNEYVEVPRSFPSPVHSQVLIVESLNAPLCTAREYDVVARRMLRRVPNFTVGNWDSTTAGFTSVVRTGLAERICLHPFGPFRFTDMLLSPSGFPSRLAGCPKAGAYALDLLPLGGNLMCVEAAHHNFRYGIRPGPENASPKSALPRTYFTPFSTLPLVCGRYGLQACGLKPATSATSRKRGFQCTPPCASRQSTTLLRVS
jgi:hypothetical protein